MKDNSERIEIKIIKTAMQCMGGQIFKWGHKEPEIIDIFSNSLKLKTLKKRQTLGAKQRKQHWISLRMGRNLFSSSRMGIAMPLGRIT